MSKPTAAKQCDTFFYLESKTDDLENWGQTETSTKQDKKKSQLKNSLSTRDTNDYFRHTLLE